MEGFFGSKVIAAVRDDKSINQACSGGVPAVFMLKASILSLPAQLERLRACGKKVFVHIDLAEGIASDQAGVRYLSRFIRPDGIISTRAPLLRYAKEEGLLTVQRLFLVDSSSLESGEKLAKSVSPDFLEVLPGLVPKAISYLKKYLSLPLIAGGMITQREDMEAAIAAGAAAVSTSSSTLWHFN